MLKPVLTALTAMAVALPAFAGSIEIDDDGWFYVDGKPAPVMMVDIDDDGWTRIDAPVVRSDRGPNRPSGTCSQLEAAAGLSGADCGVMTLSDVTAIMVDD